VGNFALARNSARNNVKLSFDFVEGMRERGEKLELGASHCASERAPDAMRGAFAVRLFLSPLNDAALVDDVLKRCPRFASMDVNAMEARDVARAIVRARDDAWDAETTLATALRADARRALEGDIHERQASTEASIGVKRANDVRASVRQTTKGTNAEYERDGRVEGDAKYAVQGTNKGTSTRRQDVVARFWNLWGGSAKCRRAMVASANGSVYRTPERLEEAVIRLDKAAPFVDAPFLLHREPELLMMETGEIVRRLALLRRVFPRGDLGHACAGTPALLLAEPTALERAVNAVKRDRNVSSSSAMLKCVTDIIQSEGVDGFLAYGGAGVDAVDSKRSTNGIDII